LIVECYKRYMIPFSQAGISVILSAEEWSVYLAIIEVVA
jgi:hypothetical protein